MSINREKEMKGSTIVRIILIGIILLVIGFAFSFFNAFYGNPISAAIATSKIRSYVKETYPEMNLEVPKATYNFKFDEYNSYVKSKTSVDTCFYVSVSNGKINDRYEIEVINKNNTFERLQKELDQTIGEILLKEFPYETSILIADFYTKDSDFSRLTLDMPFEITNLPFGVSLTVYILSNDISYENLKVKITELSKIMEKHNIPVDLFTVVLEEPMPEGEKAAPDGESLHLIDFPVEKLSEPNLIEAIKAHQKEWESLHSK